MPTLLLVRQNRTRLGNRIFAVGGARSRSWQPALSLRGRMSLLDDKVK
ncbi:MULTISPECIES: hypothetical protein [Cyanophyceae]|nr:hypothetical protein [Trichocoleus sp. FACHB-40]MBD2003077.1 hypothetical protein [Trichocoleus sp. FACHB-40]